MFDPPPRVMKIKTKINKLGLMKLKLLHSKGNHKQDEKTTFRMVENICKWSNGQRINLQNIKAHAAQYHKNKQPNQKMAEDINRHSFKEDIQTYRWPRGTWKDAQHH